MNPYQLVIDSVQIEFLHIQKYDLDYRWRIKGKKLQHSVLWYIQEGAFLLELDGKAYPCQQGQICMLPYRSTLSTSPRSDRLQLVSINFNAEIPFLKERSIADALNIPAVTNDTQDRKIMSIFNELIEHEQEGNAFGKLLFQAGLLNILYHTLNQKSLVVPGTEFGISDRRINMIIDYLLCHPAYMPSVLELSELVNLSESHLRKLFIQNTGQAPLHFVHRLKVDQAKKLLINTNKPISQIAEELGIEDANYFTRLFRKEASQSPLQYRKQFQLWSMK